MYPHSKGRTQSVATQWLDSMATRFGCAVQNARTNWAKSSTWMNLCRKAHLNFRSNAHLARRSTSSMQRLRWKCYHSTRRKKIRCESKQYRRLQAKSTRKTNVPIVMIETLASKEDIYWENLKTSNFTKTHFRALWLHYTLCSAIRQQNMKNISHFHKNIFRTARILPQKPIFCVYKRKNGTISRSKNLFFQSAWQFLWFIIS